jgi:hypothetical protein
MFLTFPWLSLQEKDLNIAIVPPAWVEVSTRGHIDAGQFDQYGYQ